MKRFLTISLLALCPLFLAAHGDDTTLWKPFSMLSYRSELSTGAIKVNLSTERGGSMADILNTNSALFVKFYSPNGLASTSLRGMGAQHTAVMWNGINLQSAMNSNMDLNLLPAFFIDQASLETAGNAATCGSGAIGGAILLNNKIKNERTVYVESSQGSFGRQSYGLAFNYKYKKFKSNTRFLYRSAENDFAYSNLFKAGRPLEKMSNNRFQQQGFMQELGCELNSKNSLYFNLWHIETARQLPAAMGASNEAEEKQDDKNTMVLLKHVYTSKKPFEWSNKLAFLNEQIDYYNKNYTDAHNAAQMLIAESAIKIKFSKHIEFESSLNETFQMAKSSDGYSNGVERNLAALFTRLNWFAEKNKLKLSLGNRVLLHNSKVAPMSPEFGAEINLNKFLKIKSNSSFSYRLPSFNDLYWNPGGNPALKPERSRKAEISVDYKQNATDFVLTGFINHVNDWIMWQPQAGSFNWKAVNVMEVESRGVEAAFEQRILLFKQHFVNFRSRYQYVISLNKASYAADQSLVGKQLFYTPNHSGFLNIDYSFKKFKIDFNTTYTGSRFATADNNPEYKLKSYVLMNLSVSKVFKIHKTESAIELSAFNLGNRMYFIVENRPMPLRNYQIKFKFNINYE